MRKSLLKSTMLLAAVLSLGTSLSSVVLAEDAKPAATTTFEVKDLKDGEYTAVSDADERGWKLHHTIVVKDGKVASSNYDYVNDKGEKKSENAEYNDKMKEKTKVSAAEAMKKLDESLVKDGKADVVTGASHTSEVFFFSTKVLLKQAKEGKTGEVNISKLPLQDGEYTLEAPADQRGWTTKFVLTVKDGKVEKADYDMYKDGKRKSEDADYNKMMADKTKVSYADAVKQLNEALVKSSNANVDVVTGATNTTNAFKTYAKQLLEAAALGEKEVIKAAVVGE